MNLSSLKVLVASLAASTFAFAGCAADPTQTEGDGEDAVESSEAEISTLSSKFVGKFVWREEESGALLDFQSLELKSTGRYEASVESGLVDPNVVCIAYPCTLPEAGTWFAYRSYGETKIRVYPTGGKPSRSYYATLSSTNDSMKLRRFGSSTKLFRAATNTCLNVKCSSGHTCQMQNGGPVCVPSITCANVLCAPGRTCEMQDGEPVCIPSITCANVDCASGMTCEMQNGAPVCVPSITCANVLCAPGTTCKMQNGAPACIPDAQKPPCQKTGCSSHICSDIDVITTCEYRPEYACYQTATCERQANGRCGFTQTPELTACLGGI